MLKALIVLLIAKHDFALLTGTEQPKGTEQPRETAEAVGHCPWQPEHKSLHLSAKAHS